MVQTEAQIIELEDEMALAVLPRTVGDRIMLALRHRGWDVLELSRRTGIPNSSVSRYVNDKSEIPRDRLERIADEFGLTPDYLLGYRPTRAWSNPQAEPVAA